MDLQFNPFFPKLSGSIRSQSFKVFLEGINSIRCSLVVHNLRKQKQSPKAMQISVSGDIL